VNWYTLYVTATGQCKAHTSVLPPSVDPAWTVIDHGANRMDQTFLWNIASRAWDIPKPVPVLVDRLADIAAHPFAAELWSRLTAAQRIKLRQLLVWILASRRYRPLGDTTPVDADDSWYADPSQVPPP
jgi:hypothetical protein